MLLDCLGDGGGVFLRFHEETALVAQIFCFAHTKGPQAAQLLEVPLNITLQHGPVAQEGTVQ